jgi:hypothetical protein
MSGLNLPGYDMENINMYPDLYASNFELLPYFPALREKGSLYTTILPISVCVSPISTFVQFN